MYESLSTSTLEDPNVDTVLVQEERILFERLNTLKLIVTDLTGRHSSREVPKYINMLLETGLSATVRLFELDYGRCTPLNVDTYLYNQSRDAELLELYKESDRMLCTSLIGHPALRRSVRVTWPHAKRALVESWNSALFWRFPTATKQSLIEIKSSIDTSRPIYNHQGPWIASYSGRVLLLWDYAPRTIYLDDEQIASRSWQSFGSWEKCSRGGYPNLWDVDFDYPTRVVIGSVRYSGRRAAKKSYEITTTQPCPSRFRVKAFCLSPDKRWLADWHRPGNMVLRDVAPDIPTIRWWFTLPTYGYRGADLEWAIEEVLTATFNSHCTILVAITTHGRVWRWDVTTGVPTGRPTRINNQHITFPPTANVSFAPECMLSAWTSSSDLHSRPSTLRQSDASESAPGHFVTVVDLARLPYAMLHLHGHSARVHAFAFSPRGVYIATASADRTVRVWRTSDGACIQTLRGHLNGGVTHVAISGNGRFLVSGADDGTVCLYTMEEVLPQGEHLDALDTADYRHGTWILDESPMIALEFEVPSFLMYGMRYNI
ncbi:WD40-repeat-containing domain protein [Daedaleopsis nitida]|nr:WD40-repeat-containing domain protein [Daedaleopsis nitida]